MKQAATASIVLARTNFQEADRIVTVLTPDYGKLRLMAKGVRRIKSKLAQGIELFSVSDIVFIEGKGEMVTLISARLRHHYPKISMNLERTMLGYELLKILNRVTEDKPESDYFTLLCQLLEALNDEQLNSNITQLWFKAQLLRIAGHSPQLRADEQRKPLTTSQRYDFNSDRMVFMPHTNGRYTANDIKYLRLLFSDTVPAAIGRITNADSYAERLTLLVQSMLGHYIRI